MQKNLNIEKTPFKVVQIKFLAMHIIVIIIESNHKQHRYICSNSQQYIVWVKIMHFSFMPKIIRY